MCAQGKTAIVSRSHFYVLLMMMIECESVLQQMCTVSYYHTGEILPFVRLLFFSTENLHFTLTFQAMQCEKFSCERRCILFFSLGPL